MNLLHEESADEGSVYLSDKTNLILNNLKSYPINSNKELPLESIFFWPESFDSKLLNSRGIYGGSDLADSGDRIGRKTVKSFH